MARYIIILFLVLTFTSTAAAQAAADTAPSTWGPAGVAVAATVIPVGLGTTLLLIQDAGVLRPESALVVLGTILGPSTGSLILGDTRRATTGALIRTAAGAALITSIGYRIAVGWDGRQEQIHLGNALIGASAALLLYGVAYNFITLPASAQASRMEPGFRWDAASGTVMPGIRLQF
jgi:hypothetical protein